MKITLILQIIQAILGVIAIGLILMRPPVADENSPNWFAPHLTLRGWEKITFSVTIIILLVFTLISILRLILG